MMRRIWPFRHVGLKVLSVGVALLLWLVVSGEETVERGLRIPLELQQFPASLELQNEPPANVDVRVRGASGTLGRLSPGDVVAVLDLHGAAPGRRLFRVTPEQVRVPFGVEVVQVNPASVALVFENSETRLVPVVPAIDGKPAPGYVIGKITADPERVDVVGPESSVKRATEAMTEPVSVAGARDRVRESVAVGLQDPLLRLKTPRAAIVTVQILPGPVERTLHDIPVHMRNIGPGLSADAVPSTVDVHLRGSREGLNRVDPDDIRMTIDLAGLGSGQYTLVTHAEVGTGGGTEVGVTRIDPPAVQVRIGSAKD